jgi:hypothetical protein
MSCIPWWVGGFRLDDLNPPVATTLRIGTRRAAARSSDFVGRSRRCCIAPQQADARENRGQPSSRFVRIGLRRYRVTQLRLKKGVAAAWSSTRVW